MNGCAVKSTWPPHWCQIMTDMTMFPWFVMNEVAHGGFAWANQTRSKLAVIVSSVGETGRLSDGDNGERRFGFWMMERRFWNEVVC